MSIVPGRIRFNPSVPEAGMTTCKGVRFRAARRPGQHAAVPALGVAIVAGTSVLLVGATCGSTPPKTVAQISPTAASEIAVVSPTSVPQNDPAAFAVCMRSHGVPDFPDPTIIAGPTGNRVIQKGRDLD